MNALFSAFGIDWHLLVINLINFGLMLVALWYFLYGPIVRMLEARRQKVAQGVIDAELAAERLAEIEASRAGTLAAAGREADEVLSRARKAALEKEKAQLAAGEAAAARIVADAETAAAEAKARAIAESRDEVAKLVVLGAEKIMRGHGGHGEHKATAAQ